MMNNNFLFRYQRLIIWAIFMITYFALSESKCDYLLLIELDSIIFMILFPLIVYLLLLFVKNNKIILFLVVMLIMINLYIVFFTNCW